MADESRFIGYPWATGRVVSQPRAASRSNIRIFSSKGLSAPGVLGTSPLAQIGTPIPGTNLVYVRPRLSQDELGGSGGSQIYRRYAYPGEGNASRMDDIASSRSAGGRVVHYTNPEYAFYRERRRTPSIGMAGAMSMGATMDVPFQSDVPYFSVA
jgi:hypothetical protein